MDKRREPGTGANRGKRGEESQGKGEAEGWKEGGRERVETGG